MGDRSKDDDESNSNNCLFSGDYCGGGGEDDVPERVAATMDDGEGRGGLDGRNILGFPTALVSRIVRRELPEDVRIEKKAVQALNRAAALFALYLNSAAGLAAASRKRATVRGADVVDGLRAIDFDDLAEEVEGQQADALSVATTTSAAPSSSLGQPHRVDGEDEEEMEQHGEEEEDEEVVVSGRGDGFEAGEIGVPDAEDGEEEHHHHHHHHRHDPLQGGGERPDPRGANSRGKNNNDDSSCQAASLLYHRPAATWEHRPPRGEKQKDVPSPDYQSVTEADVAVFKPRAAAAGRLSSPEESKEEVLRCVPPDSQTKRLPRGPKRPHDPAVVGTLNKLSAFSFAGVSHEECPQRTDDIGRDKSNNENVDSSKNAFPAVHHKSTAATTALASADDGPPPPSSRKEEFSLSLSSSSSSSSSSQTRGEESFDSGQEDTQPERGEAFVGMDVDDRQQRVVEKQ